MTTQPTEGLKPCPFPHDAIRGPFVEADEEDFFFVRVSCGDCGCAGPYVPLTDEPTEASEIEAIRLWNERRASQEQPHG